MITKIEDYFTKGSGRCKRFNTSDCSTRQWVDGLRELNRKTFEILLFLGFPYALD